MGGTGFSLGSQGAGVLPCGGEAARRAHAVAFGVEPESSRGGSWLWQASSWYESQPPAVYVLLLPSSRQSSGPSCSRLGARIPLLLLASHQPSAVPQAGGDATGSEARGPGVFWAPAGRACRVWPGGGGWERDSALSSPCLSSQDLKFNSISKEINFKVAFYARVVCALPGQRCMSRPLSRWTRSVPHLPRGGLAGSPLFGVQGCVLLSCQEPAEGGEGAAWLSWL